MTTNSNLLVASARTALKLALQELRLDPTRKILVPEFLCEVLLDPIRECGLAPRYYSTTRHLVPDWAALERIAAERTCSALVMIHYFGQPQDVTRFQALCGRQDLVLIEDNAHGHGGCLGGVPLGTFGNVGISSPRKILGTPSGGVLFGAGPRALRAGKGLGGFPLYHPAVIAKMGFRLVPAILRWLKAWRDQGRNWSDPRHHHEVPQIDFAIDVFSRHQIVAADWETVAAERRKRWTAWARFAQDKGGELLFPQVHPESCPWAMPVYLRDMNERNAWLRWGAKKRLGFFSWPTLPEEVITSAGEALARWKTLLCIPLETGPEELELQINSTASF